jgi:regulator of replication initiation timing
MTNQEDVISSLKEKIKQVIDVAEGLRTNNIHLKRQVDELLEALRAKDQEMEVLESKYQSVKLAKTLVPSPEDNKNVKLQVSRMVREIDKCIALLNR